MRPKRADSCTVMYIWRFGFRTFVLTKLSARLTAGLADRYHIEPELGRGGMATLYVARC
jgi:hypothetical protein